MGQYIVTPIIGSHCAEPAIEVQHAIVRVLIYRQEERCICNLPRGCHTSQRDLIEVSLLEIGFYIYKKRDCTLAIMYKTISGARRYKAKEETIGTALL